jgi:EmrB/QacA subfamily drug resistance transporter
MTTLDNTILNVAVPSLQRDTNASAAALQWTVESYILVRATLLFISGALSDRYGRRRCFGIGLAVFVAASLACALSANLPELISFRVVQAAGGALMTPASMGIIVNTFTDPRTRAQAVGVWSATTGLSTAAGPVIGGLLVESFGWRSVFYVNVPIGLIALACTRTLRESRSDRPRPFDIWGQLTIATALATLTYGLISAPTAGWGSLQVAIALALAILSFAGFVVAELATRSPMLDLRYFRNPALVGAVAVAIVAFLAMGGFSYFNSLYLQDVRGFSPTHAALLIMPTTAAALVLSPLSGRVTGARGPRLPVTTACVLTTGAMATLAMVTAAHSALPVLMIGYLALGTGMGLVNPPITNTAVATMPAGQAGVAAATTSTARQVGNLLGVALLGSVVYSAATAAQLGASPLQTDHAHAFTVGLQRGYGLTAALALLCVVLSLWAFRMPDQSKPTNESPSPGTAPAARVSR